MHFTNSKPYPDSLRVSRKLRRGAAGTFNICFVKIKQQKNKRIVNQNIWLETFNMSRHCLMPGFRIIATRSASRRGRDSPSLPHGVPQDVSLRIFMTVLWLDLFALSFFRWSFWPRCRFYMFFGGSFNNLNDFLKTSVLKGQMVSLLLSNSNGK